ncbi:MAG: flagellar hook protein FlgE [Proteobacteria bacterium]|nr:flagellar hook protein FlgE [Pseudomonadota bacterium]MBU1640502.1 flagellar hook protein FlgE [Pseudomonadota bacterium]
MLSGINSSSSALRSLAKKAESTANNVANGNTTGYKAARVTLQDAGNQSISTASGSGQVGLGVNVSSVDRANSQGAFESTQSSSDFAISGQGYFLLRDPGTSVADQYSRAGNFQYDQQGYLTTSAGAFVQGWQLDPTTGDRQGTIGDIRIPQTTPPAATSQVTQIVNLDARTAPEDATNSVTLFDAWDGRNAAAAQPTEAIAASNYEYKSSVAIYDSQGARQNVDIYYDTTTNNNQWEFLVTVNPLDDQRAGIDSNQKGAGALMYGTINFSTSGEITSIEAYNVPADGQVNPTLPDNQINLATADTLYSFGANFTGASDNQEVALDFGAQFSGTGTDFRPQSLASTQYANSSTTISQNQDGYGAGFLQSVATDREGVISASYSNGQVQEQGQVALANFNNPDGLRSEGGGVFRETTASGAAYTGAPGDNGLGGMAPNSLEISNVDLAEEFVSMMITKASFKANIKMIQAGDEMIGSLLDIKT